MLFEVALNADVFVYQEYYAMLEAVHEALGQWNNFRGHEALAIIIRKIDDGTPTIGITTNDESKQSERIS